MGAITPPRRVALSALMVVLALHAAAAVPAGAASGPAGTADVSTMGVLWQNSTGHNATLWSVRWSPDGSMVSAAYFDATAVVFNATTGKRVVKLGAHPVPAGRCDGLRECTVDAHMPLRTSAWSPDMKYLALAGDDRVVWIYNVSTWKLERTLGGHRGSILTLDFSPDGKYLASGSGTDKVEMNNDPNENLVKIWDAENFTLVRDLAGHRDGVMEVRWSPDGNRLVSVSDDKTIRLWESGNWSLAGELKGHTLGVLSVDFSPNGTMLVTGSRDYTVRLWDLTAMSQVAKWPAPNCVRSQDWHPGGEYIATGGVDEVMLAVRNSTTGAVLRTFTESAPTRSAIMSARWSPDGKLLAAGAGKEHTLRVYAFGTRKAPPPPAVPPWAVPTALFLLLTALGTAVMLRPAFRHMEGERR